MWGGLPADLALSNQLIITMIKDKSAHGGKRGTLKKKHRHAVGPETRSSPKIKAFFTGKSKR